MPQNLRGIGEERRRNGHYLEGDTAKGEVMIGGGGRRQGHPHFGLFGTLHLLGCMKLLIAVGLLAFVALCALEALYFRRALFVMLIPGTVILFSIMAIARHDPRLLWPIIGISFFHLFLDAYATLIFLFFFLFKPLYIIMVLNWAFDTLHTSKTPSYYAHCAAIFAFLLIFFTINLWQLRISLLFQSYLDELLGTGSSATISTGTSSGNYDGMKEEGGGGGGFPAGNGKYSAAAVDDGQQKRSCCKVLNEPPIMVSGGSTNKILLCPSPAMSQRGRGPHQIRTTALGPPMRRPSPSEARQFGTR